MVADVRSQRETEQAEDKVVETHHEYLLYMKDVSRRTNMLGLCARRARRPRGKRMMYTFRAEAACIDFVNVREYKPVANIDSLQAREGEEIARSKNVSSAHELCYDIMRGLGAKVCDGFLS